MRAARFSVVILVTLTACYPGEYADTAPATPQQPAPYMPHRREGPLGPSRGPQSSTVHVLRNGVVAAIDADHDSVVFTGGDIHDVVMVGRGPAQMAWRGERLVVTGVRDRSLSVVDLVSREVVKVITVGVEPWGVAFLDEKTVVVALQGEDAIAIVDVEAGAITKRIALSVEKPRSVGVLEDGRVVVSFLLSGVVSTIDPRTEAIEAGGTPAGQRVGSITVSHDGKEALLPSTDVTQVVAGYYFENPEHVNGAVYSADASGTSRTAVGGTDVIAVALLDGGNAIATLSRGASQLTITTFAAVNCRVATDWRTVDVGRGADGLAVSDDGGRLYVHNAFDLSLTEIDATGLLAGECGWRNDCSAGLRTITKPFARVTLADDVKLGRILFHATNDPQLTSNGFACATCHVEGRHDGLTWKAPGGLRNTPSLAGARDDVVGIASTTAPLHWDGEIATALDLSLTISRVMHGEGIPSTAMAAIAAYIDTIPAPDSRWIGTGLDENQARGREIFNDPAVGCVTCHAGPHHTDNVTHAMNDGHWQTPVLDGLASTAPYLHDGSAPTIEAVLATLVTTDQMGHGSDLTVADIAALAAYLKSL